MPFYRRIPVTIEAHQWTGHNIETLKRFGGKAIGLVGEGKRLQIHAPGGTVTACVGDYIIKGVQGEVYPCIPSAFRQTYEEVTSTNHGSPSREVPTQEPTIGE